MTYCHILIEKNPVLLFVFGTASCKICFDIQIHDYEKGKVTILSFHFYCIITFLATLAIMCAKSKTKFLPQI